MGLVVGSAMTRAWKAAGVMAALSLLLVLVLEVWALFTPVLGDTASEHVWKLSAEYTWLRYAGTGLGAVIILAIAWSMWHFFWQRRNKGGIDGQ